MIACLDLCASVVICVKTQRYYSHPCSGSHLSLESGFSLEQNGPKRYSVDESPLPENPTQADSF